MNDIEFRQKMIDTFTAAGIPWMTDETCAMLLAVLYVYGNNEQMVFSPAFKQDCEYVRDRFNIKGGETPDGDFAWLLKGYVSELENLSERGEGIPQWASDLYSGRYGIKLYS